MSEEIILRPFIQTDGYLIAQWNSDLDYFDFWRNASIVPTLQDCMNYPQWSNNIVMMVEKDNQTIGMVNLYQVNWRNRAGYAGCLIDKKFQGNNVGHDAMAKWISYLFNKFGLRKVLVEHVREYLTPAYLESGFTLVGRKKAHCDVMGELMDEIELEVFREDFILKLRGQEKELKAVNAK